MGRDNQPRSRQRKQLERKQAVIEQFDRILIVSEVILIRLNIHDVKPPAHIVAQI